MKNNTPKINLDKIKDGLGYKLKMSDTKPYEVNGGSSTCYSVEDSKEMLFHLFVGNRKEPYVSLNEILSDIKAGESFIIACKDGEFKVVRPDKPKEDPELAKDNKKVEEKEEEVVVENDKKDDTKTNNIKDDDSSDDKTISLDERKMHLVDIVGKNFKKPDDALGNDIGHLYIGNDVRVMFRHDNKNDDVIVDKINESSVFVSYDPMLSDLLLYIHKKHDSKLPNIPFIYTTLGSTELTIDSSLSKYLDVLNIWFSCDGSRLCEKILKADESHVEWFERFFKQFI